MEPVRVYGTRQEVSRIQAAYMLLSDQSRALYARLPALDRTAEVAWNLVKGEERIRAIPRPSGFQSIGQILGPREGIGDRLEAMLTTYAGSSPNSLNEK